MLRKLIDEAGTKLVAYSEEATDVPSDLLQGIALCTADDVVLTNWQIDLINSQAVLRGKESDGFVLLTAARASVTHRIHSLVWKKSQLLRKKSWCATLSGMQYFAPLLMAQHPNSQQQQQQQQRSPSEQIPEGFHWLNRDIIEEKTCSDPSISDRLNNYISTGEAVGGVVVDHGCVGQAERKLQLQRVVSRCSCQMYFCYFSDTLDFDAHNISVCRPSEQGEIWGQPEPVDCFTLKHNMLEAELRDIIAVTRSLERRSFFLNRQLQETPNDEAILEATRAVTAEIEEQKKNQVVLSDELAMTIRFLLIFCKNFICAKSREFYLCANTGSSWLVLCQLMILRFRTV
ncbi:unnamed protein product [Gongylonema pulchrum]|uniref:Uncharacterized protein n=1 Tax=Gongylonema pulchrum TaxID=637853 RepID=A0A183DQK2_9BILA|nr:unnamed protein product [Gongylonema pulchrum]